MGKFLLKRWNRWNRIKNEKMVHHHLVQRIKIINHLINLISRNLSSRIFIRLLIKRIVIRTSSVIQGNSMTAAMKLSSVRLWGKESLKNNFNVVYLFNLLKLRYGSPSRNLPTAVSASNYREPRNFENGRQHHQSALPPGARVSSRSHESVQQHPYSSSSNKNRMSDRRPSPPRQRHPSSRYPDDYQSNISYEGPPSNYFDDSDRKMAYAPREQYHEGGILI